MTALRVIAFSCLLGISAAQYGPPKETGPVKHRTTTTTLSPPSVNDIFPEPGDSAYQPSPEYQTQPSQSGYQSQPAQQPGYGNQQGQQPVSQADHSTPHAGSPYTSGQPSYQQAVPPPPGSAPVKPVDISNNPFINAGISGRPVTSSEYQPKPGANVPAYPGQQPAYPVPHPGFQGPQLGGPIHQQGVPAPQPGSQPTQPSYPAPGYQPSQPATPPNRPINIQGNPFLSGAVKPQRPSAPNQPQQTNQPGYQPTKPDSPYQPSIGSGPTSQPGYQPTKPDSPYQPSTGSGPTSQPGYQPTKPDSPYQPSPASQPGLNPNSPTQYPGTQPSPQGQHTIQQGQQPYQPGQPSYGAGLPIPSGSTPQQPSLPSQPSYQSPQYPGARPPAPGQQPAQPAQQTYQPGTSYEAGQPTYGSGQPSYGAGKPIQPGQNPPNPSNSGQQTYQPNKPGQTWYQPGQQGKPNQPNQYDVPSQQGAAPACYGPGSFCVPSSSCYNGIITGNSAPEASYKSGQCNPGEVCCTGQPKATPYSPGYVTEGPATKYTGPLNTTPPPECAAALKCVPESYCDEKGVMRDGPVALTREQQENKVALSDCQNLDTGVIGKCCRDPNYKDPWPAGMMMGKTQDGQGFDDGQYKPDQYPGEKGVPGAQPAINYYNQGPQQYHPSPAVQTIAPPNPYTIKKPLGVFGGEVTPFPVAPKPGQTHQDVFPQNEDKVAGQPGAYPQTAGPQPHPVPLPNLSAESPSPISTSSYGITPPAQAGAPGGDFLFPGQTPPQQQLGPGGLPGTFRPPLPGAGQPTGYQSQPQPNGSSDKPIIPGQQCGVRRPVPSTAGDETGFGEFPWHAIIQSSNNRSSICSAVIIASNAVLTAAHCIQGLKPEEMVVRAGEWILQQQGPKPVQSRVAGATAIHPVYNSGSLVKDQAIVVTEVPFQFDQNVDKVCLPTSGSGDYVPKTRTCYLTGFGRPALQNNSPGSVLHKIPVTIVPKEQCENNLKQTHLGKYFKLNEGFACAAPVSEAELCKVDVGSPLVCDRGDGQFEVAGVYSWDTKCTSSQPGVLASPDSDWINQVLSTPVDTLRAEQQSQKPLDHLPIDVEEKPGFALGYGK